MGIELDLKIEIAGLAVAQAGTALPRQSDPLAGSDAFRNAYIQSAFTNNDVAVVGQLGRPQGDGSLSAGIRVFEIHGHLGMVVLATGTKPMMAAPATMAPATEQRIDKVAELGSIGFGVAAVAKLETLIPVRRGPEVLTRLPLGAELIVGSPFLGILQYLVGLADFLESILGLRGHC